MSATVNTYYEGLLLIKIIFLIKIQLFISTEQQPIATPDVADLEKHYIDAKAYILSATTKDGTNL